MSLSRQLKRKQGQKPVIKSNLQFFSNDVKETAKKLEEGFVAAGELKGIAMTEEIFRERFIENVPQIKGVGKHFRQEFAKAMGLIFTDEEIKRMEQKK
jgi:hypothetical protein